MPSSVIYLKVGNYYDSTISGVMVLGSWLRYIELFLGPMGIFCLLPISTVLFTLLPLKDKHEIFSVFT